MAHRAYSEINLHIVWRVKDGSPVLRDAIETQLHRYLKGRSVKAPGVFCHAVGGADDHVHMAVTVPPTLVISEWVGQVKGASAHFINHEIANRKLLEWQKGYGVISFGKKDLPWVVGYIREQRQHHTRGNVQTRLERTEAEDEKPAEAG